MHTQAYCLLFNAFPRYYKSSWTDEMESMCVHTTCIVCIRNTSRVWICHTQHYSNCNQSQLFFILLENVNLHKLTGIHNNYMIWKSIQKLIFCTSLLIVALTLFVWNQHTSLRLPNTIFEQLFLTEKLQTSTSVSCKHEFLTVIITPEKVASSNNIQHFL